MRNYSFQEYTRARDDIHNESLWGMAKNAGRFIRGGAKSVIGDRQGGTEDMRGAASGFGGELANTAGNVATGANRITGGVLRRGAKLANKAGRAMGSTYGEPPTAQITPAPPMAAQMQGKDLGQFITQLRGGSPADIELADRIEKPFEIWMRKQGKAAKTHDEPPQSHFDAASAALPMPPRKPGGKKRKIK